jgi:hypothetical protein
METQFGVFEMRRNSKFDTTTQVLQHLIDHKHAGHKVPKYALERLMREIAGNER